MHAGDLSGLVMETSRDTSLHMGQVIAVKVEILVHVCGCQQRYPDIVCQMEHQHQLAHRCSFFSWTLCYEKRVSGLLPTPQLTWLSAKPSCDGKRVLWWSLFTGPKKVHQHTSSPSHSHQCQFCKYLCLELGHNSRDWRAHCCAFSSEKLLCTWSKWTSIL